MSLSTIDEVFCALIKFKKEYADQIKKLSLEFPITFIINYQDLKQISQNFAQYLVNYPKESLHKLKESLINVILTQLYIYSNYAELKKRDEIFECTNDAEIRLKIIPSFEKLEDFYRNNIKKTLTSHSKLDLLANFSRVHIMIFNLDKVLDVNELTAEYANKLVSVRGIIADISDLKGKYVNPVFVHEEENEYHKFGERFVYPLPRDGHLDLELEDEIEKPSYCTICGRSGHIKISEEESEIVDRKIIRLLQSVNNVDVNKRETEINVIVEDNLVKLANNLSVGDEIIVTGILVPENGKKGEVKGFHIHAIHIQVIDNRPKLSEEQVVKLKRIAEEYSQKPGENGFDRLMTVIAHSIKPDVEWPIEYKLMMALSIIKGVTLKDKAGSLIKRGSIHIAIVGDPATGKTSVASKLVDLEPGRRAVYVSGPTASVAGIVGAVVKNEKSGEFEVKRGVFARANNGVLIIDEIDKMPKEILDASLEILEKEKITISKAVSMETEAHTSVIFILNPRLGRFDESEPVYMQINLPQPFISRIDFWIVLKDEDKDDKAIKKMLNADYYANLNKREQLQLTDFDIIDAEIFDEDFLKQYFALAQTIVPTLTREAKLKIEEYFKKLRRVNISYPQSAIKITKRQLQSLIRISEAIAKLHLRDHVTVKDVEYAIKLYEFSLQALGFDPKTWNIDIDALETGIPGDYRYKITKMLEIIDSLARVSGCARASDIYNIASKELYMNAKEIDDLIKMMKQKNLIFEAKKDCYKES